MLETRLGVLILGGLLPLLAGCSTAPVPSEFGDVPAPRVRPVVKKRLNCRDERSIRDFKDFTLSEVQGDADEVERWALCLCGDASRRAGVNGIRPRPADGASGFPSYDLSRPEQSLAGIRDWLKAHLPLDEAQAARLAECLYGRP
ncbi:MAG: hypothetical protein HY926_05470 [Elusimicrobia bacterium]|nr:hypothetical protein [Elusimicrobiota bacterium]